MSYVGNTPTQQAFTPAIDYFSGNGSTVAFTLSRPVASVAQVQVVVNNVPQNPSTAFTVLNNTITFTGAPSSGTNNIYVEYTSPITQIMQPGQGTVGTVQLVDASVTTAKLASGLTLSGTTTFGGIVNTGSTGQVKFPATQNASADANTLDDYEEGTWTPGFSPGSASTANFTYTKIGRVVQLTGYINSPSGWGSGTVSISGLPFVGAGNYQMSLLWYNGVSSVIAAAYLPDGSATLVLRPIGGAPSTFTELSVQMSYITNA